MSIVLTTEQREQAGSDSYNRFEYQVHWIVCHIIGKLQDNTECIVFCEFHDDMAEFSTDNQQYQFYQIKTKEDPSDWTVAEMSKREKKKSGGYKKSFLGFIFYNYLTFGTECSHCHFVSNNDFDKEVLSWQAVIEDGKKLQVENVTLYEKIKDRIKDELFISARTSDDDKIVALNIGGDDYIQKPYSLGVLLAKVKVVLKRYGQKDNTEYSDGCRVPTRSLRICIPTDLSDRWNERDG